MSADLINMINQGANVVLQVNANDLRIIITEMVTAERNRLNAEIAANKERPALTRKQAAEMLGVSLATLWKWDKQGYLKPCKVGAKCLYKQCDIDNLLQTKSYKFQRK